MEIFLDFIKGLAEFEELTGVVSKKQTPVNVVGVSDSVRAHLIYCVCKKLNKYGLVVAPDDSSALEIYEDLKFFAKEDTVLFFPGTDLLFYDIEAKSHDVTKQRLSVLHRLALNEGKCHVVTSVDALLSVTLPRTVYETACFSLEVGDEIALEVLAEKLVMLGYKREDMVEGPGQFSIRGGIADIYLCGGNYDEPVRIEFFDTEVDAVRIFDHETQRTIDRMEKVTVLPAGEVVLDSAARKKLVKKLLTMLEKVDSATEAGKRLASVCRRDIERLQEGMYFPSLDKYIPLIYREKPTLMEYLGEETAVFWQEPARIAEHRKLEEARFAEDLVDFSERGIIVSADGAYTYPYPSAVTRLCKRPFLGVSGLSHASPDYRPVRTLNFTTKSLNGFQGKLEFLCEALRFYKDNRYRTVILAGSDVRAKNLVRQLQAEEISCGYADNLEKMPEPGGIAVTQGSIARGFEYPLIRTVVIGDREIFGGEKRKSRRKKPRKGEKIENFTDLNVGDFVVHQNHGIGQYMGIEQLAVDGVRKDYLKIRYKDDDFLYVPADQLDMVYKHIGKEGAAVRVNKLGGNEWNRTKQKVKAAAADMAKELIALYAQRSSMPGIAFSADSEWQHDFEAAFPYEETEDQLRSIAEVKRDMEIPHPMDRLLCGDVGYGKTEVAIRAAFKAVMSGYQVAYLVPTTVLASQHYHTFKQRMMDYPVNVGMLSRFCTAAEERNVKRQLASGELDVVIGTHKLLGKGVKYNKLGLLIIDEEQRFGVGHKEKLKEIRKEVDVLTLSATPIPRTLHMSLTGIRDMSVINQPPGDRHPVSTYVLEYDENVVREAISREISRGGQVYYLFNRVQGIYKAANRIGELVPGIRVGVAHGQMSETELEEIMMALDSGEIDVLVCTTIIETGLDIPNVNTIVIEDADRLGLAQLYQLRGRVGRSNRLAYAYLTFRRNKMLTPEAEKRLLAIKEFTEFGSGFKIAMRDLEIRGTGNLIGAQQHGHMEAVGYEMYCRLLEEAVAQQRGIPIQKETETLIDLPVSAYIPEQYIQNHSQRIQAYKRIAAISDQEAFYDAYDEIEDRYGTVPQVVYNLMEVSLLKAMAQKAGIAELIGNTERITLLFDEENLPDMQICVDLVTEDARKYVLASPAKPKMICKIGKDKKISETEYLKQVRDLLDKFVSA